MIYGLDPRLEFAYRTDIVVRAVLDAGGDYIDVINELSKERHRLIDQAIEERMNQVPKYMVVKETHEKH